MVRPSIVKSVCFSLEIQCGDVSIRAAPHSYRWPTMRPGAGPHPLFRGEGLRARSAPAGSVSGERAKTGTVSAEAANPEEYACATRAGICVHIMPLGTKLLYTHVGKGLLPLSFSLGEKPILRRRCRTTPQVCHSDQIPDEPFQEFPSVQDGRRRAEPGARGRTRE